MNKSTKWTDLLMSLASLAIIGVSIWWLLSTGVFSYDLNADEKLAWHLVRSSGMVAYIALIGSTIWGLFMSSQFVKDWSPGPVSMTIHATLSWLALLIGLIHGLLLLFDDYFTYTISDILVPFTGPYRPEVVGLGTLGFWLMLIISITFPLKRWIGHKTWKRLHYVSYAVYAIVTVHGLMAGTDSELLGFRLLTGAGILFVTILLGIRLGKDQAKPARRPSRSRAGEEKRKRDTLPDTAE